LLAKAAYQLAYVVTDTPHSRASPLPHVDLLWAIGRRKAGDLTFIDYSLMRNARHARMIRDPLPTYSAKAPLSTLFRPRLNRPTGRCLR